MGDWAIFRVIDEGKYKDRQQTKETYSEGRVKKDGRMRLKSTKGKDSNHWRRYGVAGAVSVAL